MKKLIFFLSLVFLLSCEKDEPQPQMPENECWECLFYFPTIPKQEIKSYCNRLDLKLSPAGPIKQADIILFEQRMTNSMCDVICYRVK